MTVLKSKPSINIKLLPESPIEPSFFNFRRTEETFTVTYRNEHCELITVTGKLRFHEELTDPHIADVELTFRDAEGNPAGYYAGTFRTPDGISRRELIRAALKEMRSESNRAMVQLYKATLKED